MVEATDASVANEAAEHLAAVVRARWGTDRELPSHASARVAAWGGDWRRSALSVAPLAAVAGAVSTTSQAISARAAAEDDAPPPGSGDPTTCGRRRSIVRPSTPSTSATTTPPSDDDAARAATRRACPTAAGVDLRRLHVPPRLLRPAGGRPVRRRRRSPTDDRARLADAYAFLLPRGQASPSPSTTTPTLPLPNYTVTANGASRQRLPRRRRVRVVQRLRRRRRTARHVLDRWPADRPSGPARTNDRRRSRR